MNHAIKKTNLHATLLLTKVVQEQQAQIASLRARIQRLETHTAANKNK
jgi:ribosomal protein S15P/S13E